jgi:hypothetical protein
MKVFISWSKEKSRLTAEALNKWLPKVIQAVEPWISPEIEKGKRWSPEINDNLENSKVGIFCLDQENLNEPWILFEAGAMAKTKDAYVCTFLLDLTPTDVQQPLAQFQHTKYEKEDVKKLVHTINSALEKYNEKALKKEVLNEAFDKYWVDLDEELKEIKKKNQPKASIKRSDRELLEEMLEILRNQQSSNMHGLAYVSAGTVPMAFYDSSKSAKPIEYTPLKSNRISHGFLKNGEVFLSEPLPVEEISKSTKNLDESAIQKIKNLSRKKK